MKNNIRILRLFVCVSIIFNFQFLFFNSASAQQPWNFPHIDSAALDDAYLLAPPDSLRRQIEHATSFQVQYNTSYRLFPLSRRHIAFQNADTTFSLPLPLASSLLPYLVSHRYWQKRYSRLQQWAFVDMDKAAILLDVDTANHRYGRFAPLSWLGYSFQPSAQWPVVFSVRTNTHRLQQLSLPALQRLAEWGAFATDEAQLAYERSLDSLQRARRDAQLSLQHDMDSLSSISGFLARQADSIALALRHDSIQHIEQQSLLQVQATKEKMNRQQIFLMSLKPARSDYMFGLEFNFYNCFQKTISTIEISVIPVDAKGRLQRDRFKRDERTVRCMGPIQPGSPAQYTFDELFWDDSGKIKYMRVTDIIFHFTDGSRKAFNGYEKILKHTLNP